MYTRWKNFKLFIRNFIKGKSTFNSEINYKGVDDSVKLFVRETIIQICLGVSEARDNLEKEGNRGWINLVKESDAKNYNYPTQTIEFDVSFNTIITNKIGGGIEAKTVLNLSGENSKGNESLTRAKFSVPITLPCTILKENI